MIFRLLAGVSAAFVAAGLVFAGAADAQKLPCPVSVDAAASAGTTYTNRGDRCEGLFRQPVAASAELRIIGFHRHPPSFAVRSGVPIQVAVTPRTASTPIRLRVVSAKQRQYYRMDAAVPAGGRFTWKRDVIDHSGVMLEPQNTKAIACEGDCERAEPTLLAVSIAETPQAPSPVVSIWLRASLDLSQLNVTLERKGSPKPEMANVEVLQQRVMPAGAARPIEVKLAPGIYSFRATAVPIGQNAVDEVRATLVVPGAP